MTHYLRALAARLRGLFGDRRAERELDDEIETHLRLLTERYVRQGMTEEEAARAARRQFGNVTLLKEANREMRGIRLIDTFFQDLRYGLTMLMRLTGAGVTLGVTVALALTRVLKNLLFEVKPTDPGTFALIALLLVGVALIASYIPARRATRVDPLQALRHE
ncbi:MAG TPA: permease prefix domain 1-containing protein [Blastocatellia bacterium]|jgi:ABC-type transport system, involved in lipoprotein release, permease component